ncbi:MAG: diacylglycerol/lipid kinase family protein [Gemmatimonadota bacterium]
MKGELPIFVNPGAGQHTGDPRTALERAFESAGARPSIHVLNRAEMQAAIREAIARGADIIGIAGGDGTISSAAHALVHSGAALLPIPLGTFNHFATRYGIPTIEAAVHAWQRATVQPVHVGSVNERTFVNNASCGFYPHIVRHRERLERVLPRVAAMWLAGLRVLLELPMLQVTVHATGETIEVRTPALWVGIGRNSLRLPPTASASASASELLEAVWARAETRTAVLAVSFRLLRHLRRELEPRDSRLDVVRTSTLTLRSTHPIDIALDGEPLRLVTPLRFEIREAALRVVVVGARAAQPYTVER